MAKNRLKPLSPIALAIDSIDETIRKLRLRRNELAALLPKQVRQRQADNYVINPLNGRRYRVKAAS